MLRDKIKLVRYWSHELEPFKPQATTNAADAMAGSDATSVSTGNRTILGRITKRGNRYLRMLFAQGARAILLRPMSWAKHSFGPWLTAAARRLHRNVLAAALANKLARIGEHHPY